MNANLFRLRTLQAVVAAMLAVAASAAAADDKPRQQPANPAWQEECGSCHVAYPARLLPAESWRRLMGSLEEHFGTDASLEPDKQAEITAFLVANARSRRSDGEEAPLRITEMKWFRSEHRRFTAAKWQSPEIGSAANCGACHRGADAGRFGEKDIRVP